MTGRWVCAPLCVWAALLAPLVARAADGGVLPPLDWAGCAAQQTSRAGVRITCADAQAAWAGLGPGHTPAQAVVALREGLLRTLPHTQPPVETLVAVGDSARPGWLLRVLGHPKDTVAMAEVWVVPQEHWRNGPGLLSCTLKGRHRGGQRRCAALLQSLASVALGGQPDAVLAELLAPLGFASGGQDDVWPAWLGPVPQTTGCVLVAARTLRCAEVELSWQRLDAGATLQSHANVEHAALSLLGQVAHADCVATVAGGSATCRGLDLELPVGGRAEVALVLVSSDGGADVLLRCMTRMSLRQGTPQPCAAVMQVTAFEPRGATP